MFRQPRGYALLPFSYGFCMQEQIVQYKLAPAFSAVYPKELQVRKRRLEGCRSGKTPSQGWKGEFFFFIINDMGNGIKRKGCAWRSQKRLQLLHRLLLGGQEFLCKGSGLSVSMRQIVQAFGQADNSHCCAVDGQLGQV